MASSKLRKISKIVKEITIRPGQPIYDISGLDLGLCKFYYRLSQEQFQDLHSGDYTIHRSDNSQTIEIRNSVILSTAEALQVCYQVDLTSSKYETDFNVDINRLASSYNQVVDDLHVLWEYVRDTGMISDDTAIDLILPQLNTDEIWVKTDDGYKGVSLTDAEGEIKKVIEKYTSEMIGKIDKASQNIFDKEVETGKQEITDHTTSEMNRITDVVDNIMEQQYKYKLPIGENTVILPDFFIPSNKTKVFVNGLYLSTPEDYDFEGRVITLKQTYDDIADVFVNCSLDGKVNDLSIIGVNVNVDDKVGIPNATGVVKQDILTLDFKNLKGVKGDKGDKGDKPTKGIDYYTPQEQEQFTHETINLVMAEGQQVIEEIKKIIGDTPEAGNALTLGGKTRPEFEQDVENLKNEIIEIKENIKEFSLKTLSEPLENMSGIVTSSIRGGYGSNNGTTSYILDFKEKTTIYFGETTAPYLSIVAIENPISREWEQSGPNYFLTGKSATRKRNIEGNLPKENSPYTTSDTVIIITITANHDVPVFMTVRDKILSKNIDLNDNHIAQVLDNIPNLSQLRKPCVQYVPVDKQDFPNSYNKEQLDIYIPTEIGYIKYCFLRNELDSYNANNWRLDKAFAYDEMMKKRFLIINSGEYEMALQLNGRSDFIGGIAHGDEVFQNITFLLDGVNIKNISSLTNITKFETLRIIETTKLYDPNDKATLTTNNQYTPIATHGKEYIITKSGIRLKQFVKWLKAETLTASYMTMLPIVRGNDSISSLQITDTFYADDDYILYDVSTNAGASGNAWAWRKNCNRCVIWSDKSGVCADVEMLKQPQINNKGARQFKIQDSSLYNKLYWSVCGVGGALYDVSANERFETDTIFKININK